MIFAIIMAGGLGTRLKVPNEKPIFNFKDKPLISHVIENLEESSLFDKIFIAISPNTPNTKEYLSTIDNIDIIDTPGIDYLYDLSFILDLFEKNSPDDTLLFINADLPLIDGEILKSVLDSYFKSNKDSLSVYVPVEIFDELGLSYSYEYNGLVPSGLNILRSENIIQEQEELIISNPRLAININTLHDVDVANDF